MSTANNRFTLFILLVALALFGQVGWASPDDKAILQEAERVVSAVDSSDVANIEVTVVAGVVTVRGSTGVDAAIFTQALSTIDGVRVVMNQLDDSPLPDEPLQPAVNRVEQLGWAFIDYLPLLGVALAIMVGFWLLSKLVNLAQPILVRAIPVASVRNVISQILRLVIMLVGFVVALEVLNATALVGGVLGAAGVAGIAIGFAFRDLIENYLASVMLGLRQPFRPGDHVNISGDEGIVARLTSRSTIIMTFDGNRLRIPNAEVFKARILNYSTTPERRFQFDVGIGYQVDPSHAIKLGVETLRELDGVSADPGPVGRVVQLGDSTIQLTFSAWVDQEEASFGAVRSRALTTIKRVFDSHQLEMPEPTYNLRILSQAVPSTSEPAPATPSTERSGDTKLTVEDQDSGMDFAREQAAKEAAAADDRMSSDQTTETLD